MRKQESSGWEVFGAKDQDRLVFLKLQWLGITPEIAEKLKMEGTSPESRKLT